ncbi:uncharacterized protein LOC127830986 [Dreissena polymorpha]|uniref:Uncharacterized protein n=1 Tax=Dreissena polymorpha TaxID=45954 RepID=A0A9D4GU69_DREPO|nr:uncharacterized protein LOC127830986 [Dreissena polymorpha]KAH3823135.1 hypothetical protein DPMN_124934 [Dreissena polymorpha]
MSSSTTWAELTQFQCPVSGCPSKESQSWVCERDDTTMFMNSNGEISCQLGTHRGNINTWVWNCGDSFHRWNDNKASLDSFAEAMSQDIGSLSKMGACWYAALILELGKQFKSSSRTYSTTSSNATKAKRIPSSTKSSSMSSSSTWVALDEFRCPVSKCRSWGSRLWVCNHDGSSMFINAEGKMKCAIGTHEADICKWGWSCGDSCHREMDDQASEGGFSNALGLNSQAMSKLGSVGVKTLISELEKQFSSSGSVIYFTRAG